jgi:hypothetical protein
MRFYLAPLVAASALALGGCGYYDGVYGGAGYGYNDYSYRDYGYYNPYSYSGFGYPYSYGSYYGWYGDSYYPGTGLYVYDTYRRPRLMTSTQRSYWMSRQPRTVTATSTVRTQSVRPNWSAFNRGATVQAQRQAMRQERRSQQ